MKRPAKLTLRAEEKGFGGKTIFRTARGWVDARDLTDRTPAEELAKMREEAQEKLTYLKNHPAPQFYHVFRPLLDISAKNPTRIKLAQKAILSIWLSIRSLGIRQLHASCRNNETSLGQNIPAPSKKTALKIKKATSEWLTTFIQLPRRT